MASRPVLSYLDPQTGFHIQLYRLAPELHGLSAIPDPDHSYSGGRIDYNGGAMDGFLKKHFQ